MKVYSSLDNFGKLDYAVVTTGTFDGVHLGHRKILSQLNTVARENNGESVLLTFNPHPRMILQPDIHFKMINSQQEKIDLLRDTGIGYLIVHPFTREFSRITSLNFVRNILVNSIGAKKLVIGHDHHFGCNREGSFKSLKEYGSGYDFKVEEIPPESENNITVSSTKIRRALDEGDIKTANRYLTYDFSLNGKVVSGEKMGSKLAFPTANIVPEDNDKIIPGDGVYAIKARLPATPEHLYYGMCNIGLRPTFDGRFRTIEVHLFDFDKNIYGRRISLYFKDRLRGEMKFDNGDELRQQLCEDESKARKILVSTQLKKLENACEHNSP